jgi:hypothetical protein
MKNAICIGINNYPGTSSDLSGCVNDARDWAEVLSQRGLNVVAHMEDAAATADNITAELRKAVADLHDGDLLVVTFSGHGSFVPDEDGDEADGQDEIWCPYDIMDGGMVKDDDLFDLFSEAECGSRIVLLSDSCHSGTVSRFMPLSVSHATAPRRSVRFLPPPVFLSRADRALLPYGERIRVAYSPVGAHSALVLSGCQDAEYSYDAWFNGRPNGAFTRAAIDSLLEFDSSVGGWDYSDWHSVIRSVLPSHEYPQTPNLFGSPRMRRWSVLLDVQEEGE